MADRNELILEGVLTQVECKPIRVGMNMCTAVLVHEAWWSRNKVRIPVKAFGPQADNMKEIPEDTPVLILANLGASTFREKDYPEVLVRSVWIGQDLPKKKAPVETVESEGEDEEAPF